jgi:hypothetical protein
MGLPGFIIVALILYAIGLLIAWLIWGREASGGA